ncbi:FAD-binding oxidoreductase [Streptomyces sp. NPDC057387]|uniref:FAD-binding oxidoreductase n=1 Tax=Streptomyces sp. NPDC057387 TaxID=3346115 RepID=UPI0036298522
MTGNPDAARQGTTPVDASAGQPATELPSAVVAAWRRVLGEAHVLTAPEDRATAGQCTFPAPLPQAVLCPADAGQTRDCLRIAHRHGVRVHPVSTGRNWGYGSGCPPDERTVVLRLARLDRILGHDEQLGLVTVEPGVTFGQLAEALGQRSSQLLPPSTGAGPSTSVLANALQRGLGRGPYQDMASHLRRLEVVRPDGGRLSTGPGPGPGLTGLFLQGGPGVVVAAELWLHPRPRVTRSVVFRVPDGRLLPGVVDAARRLLQRAPGGVAVSLWNRARLAAQVLPAPRSRLPEHLDGPWTGHAELWADDPRMLDLIYEFVLRAFAPYADHWDTDDVTGSVAAPGAPGLPEGAARHDGAPGLASAYRHKPGGPLYVPAGRERDPDRDRCGVLWFTPQLPMSGARTDAVLRLVERIMTDRGMEPCLALRLGARDLRCVTGLFWDRDEPGADARALECRRELVRRCARIGVHPHRPVIGDDLGDPGNAGSRLLLDQVASALDPRGVLRARPRRGAGR